MCGTGVACLRKINIEAAVFGTTGKLYNSNPVMYDRRTDAYWNLISGLAIMGELCRMRLVPVPVNIIA